MRASEIRSLGLKGERNFSHRKRQAYRNVWIGWRVYLCVFLITWLLPAMENLLEKTIKPSQRRVNIWFLLMACASWFLGSLPWHWVTTRKALPRQRPGPAIIPVTAIEEEAVTWKEKDYSSILPCFPLLSLSAFTFFVSLLPSLCLCILHIHILSLSSHPSCPPLPSRSTLSYIFCTFTFTAQLPPFSSLICFLYFRSTVNLLLPTTPHETAFILMQKTS